MLQLGMRYTILWRLDENGIQYERVVVLAQEGVVIKVKNDTGKESVINMSTPNFIRADLQA